MTYAEAEAAVRVVCAMNAVTALPDSCGAKRICIAALLAEWYALPGEVREAVGRGVMPKEVWE